MKPLALLIVTVLLFSGCSRPSPQSQESTNSGDAHKKPEEPKAAKFPELAYPKLSVQDRQSVKRFAEETLYKGKAEEDVYADVRKQDMHYLYVAFLEMFPASAHKPEVEKRMTQFREFTVTASQTAVFTDQELKDEFNWDSKEKLFPWADSLSGTVRNDKGGRDYFGELCLGNLQLNGSWRFEKDGMHLFGGSKIIYPLDKPMAPSTNSK